MASSSEKFRVSANQKPQKLTHGRLTAPTRGNNRYLPGIIAPSVMGETLYPQWLLSAGKYLEESIRQEARKRALEQNYGKDLQDPSSTKKMNSKLYVSEFSLKFTNPVQHLSHGQQWRPREYFVSEKIDGRRCLVLCSCDGSVWCLRSRKQVTSRKVGYVLAC